MNMKISFIRGAYLNNFEGQNFDFSNQKDIDFRGYSSLFPIDDKVPFPVIRLFSLADLQTIPVLADVVRYVANRTLGDSQILFGLEKYISSSDIVHTADPHYYYSYQAAILRKKGAIKKLISTWWETIPFNNEGTAAKKRIKKFTMDNTDLFLCYAEKAKQCLLQEGVPQNKIIVIPLGVDISQFKPLKKNNETITILFAGRLVEEKGILDLYVAFKEILNRKIRAQLRIVGQGPLEDRLRESILKDGLTDVVTIGKKSYSEMPSVYQQVDIFCVPSKKTCSWEEQYGMVFIEAMASGLPIVSYNTGSIPELVDACGLFAKANDVSNLSTLIIQIIRAKELGEKLGTMGRERAKTIFDAKKTALRLVEFYRSLCK